MLYCQSRRLIVIFVCIPHWVQQGSWISSSEAYTISNAGSSLSKVYVNSDVEAIDRKRKVRAEMGPRLFSHGATRCYVTRDVRLTVKHRFEHLSDVTPDIIGSYNYSTVVMT